MKCPKCQHEQPRAAECRNCGVIFAKYEAVQKRRQKDEARKEKESASGSGIARYVQLALVILVVAGGIYYFTGDATDDNLAMPGSTSETGIPAPASRGSAGLQPAGELNAGSSTAAASADSIVLSGSSPVERARRATVSIETPWGTGSGFFIDKNYIVTNKHVVEFDQGELEKIQRKIQTNRRLIDLEEQKIAQMRRELRKMPKGPARSQLEILIRQRQEYLAKVTVKQQQNEDRLARLEKDSAAPQIKIILDDGSEHFAGYMISSPQYDLALLALFSHDGVSLEKPPPDRPIRQGDTVFTVGSPVGLRHTVTSGVFSGYRKREIDNHVFLQTDAAINPGNSGGPLIDEYGFVHGVNTMILRDTEGIGFAIPIDRVFEEFSSSLPASF